MKKCYAILMTTILCMVCLSNCAPSESVVQTAIASTKEIDDSILEETSMALRAATQEALSIQSTQEFEIGQTQTVGALSVAQTQAAIPKNCTPGGTYVDFEGDIDIDYLDIIKVETSLEKEVLTAIFYLKSLPEEITINREGTEEGRNEYYWGVCVDVDNDIDTGGHHAMTGDFPGIDYDLSLYHFARGESETGKLDEVMKDDALVWRASKEKYTEIYQRADLMVNYEQNTITLSGWIPKINENSLLYFAAQEAYGFAPVSDFLCEQKTTVAEQTEQAEIDPTITTEAIAESQTKKAIPGSCTPGGTYIDLEGDTTFDIFDILSVETLLEGENLTVTFFLANIPEEITINTASEGYSEYGWVVEIDVDQDTDTGTSGYESITGRAGIDYTLSLFHFSWGEEKTGPIESVLADDASIWKPSSNGMGMETSGRASFTVDYDLKTISIKGKISGINKDSLLYFHTEKDSIEDSLYD